MQTKKKKIKKFICKDCGKKFTKLAEDEICWNCKQKRDALTNQSPIKDTGNSKYLADVLRLRAEGKSYRQIASELGCSKSTISYLLSEKTRENIVKKIERYKDERPWVIKLWKLLDNFKRRKQGSGKVSMTKDWNKKIRTSVSQFKRSLETLPMKDYTYKDVIDHFGGTIVTCELTGRQIDITKDDYNLDHIVPVARGGSNELDNMAFTIPDANAAKHQMTNEEFVMLCKEVCEHFGYTVTK